MKMSILEGSIDKPCDGKVVTSEQPHALPQDSLIVVTRCWISTFLE